MKPKAAVAVDKDGDLDATMRTQEMEVQNREISFTLLALAGLKNSGLCPKKIATRMHKLFLSTVY